MQSSSSFQSKLQRCPFLLESAVSWTSTMQRSVDPHTQLQCAQPLAAPTNHLHQTIQPQQKRLRLNMFSVTAGIPQSMSTNPRKYYSPGVVEHLRLQHFLPTPLSICLSAFISQRHQQPSSMPNEYQFGSCAM